MPTAPGASAAQREFNEDYLSTLTGFPFESTASVMASGDLDPASVTSQSVRVFDVDAPDTALAVLPAFDAGTKSIVIAPPVTGWPRGHRIGVAVVGGSSGVHGAQGEPVVGSSVWALVRLKHSLVTCADLTSKDCQATTDIIPSQETDPGARLADQAKSAVALESLRRLYLPLLDGLDAVGVPRSDVAILWTFGVVDAGEMTFDPANEVIPFPNDVLRNVDAATQTAHVALPGPDGNALTVEQCAGAASNPLLALTCGLNTLDGFSTLASPISRTPTTWEPSCKGISPQPLWLRTKALALFPWCPARRRPKERRPPTSLVSTASRARRRMARCPSLRSSSSGSSRHLSTRRPHTLPTSPRTRRTPRGRTSLPRRRLPFCDPPRPLSTPLARARSRSSATRKLNSSSRSARPSSPCSMASRQRGSRANSSRSALPSPRSRRPRSSTNSTSYRQTLRSSFQRHPRTSWMRPPVTRPRRPPRASPLTRWARSSSASL